LDKKPPIKLSFLSRGPDFKEKYLNYHKNSGFEKFHRAMRDRRYTVGELGTSSRVINHWEEKNVLPDGFREKDNGWRKFTLAEVAWLSVAAHLRKFGFPLEKIVKVKSQILDWQPKLNMYPVFEFQLARALVSKEDLYVAVLEDGYAAVASSVEIEESKLLDGPQHILLISLKKIVSALQLPNKNPESIHGLSNEEEHLLGEVRLKNNSEIKVSIKNSKISEIDTEKRYSDVTILPTINTRFNKEGEYGEISVKIEDGKKQLVTVRKKKRF